MEAFRYTLVAFLSAAIVLFALQNLGPVDVDFLAWHFRASVALLTLVPFLAGLVAGMLGGLVRGRARRPAAGEAVPAGPGGEEVQG